jgi:hypothetical protein
MGMFRLKIINTSDDNPVLEYKQVDIFYNLKKL